MLRELAEETIGIMAETVNQPAMVYREPGAFNPANLRADQNLGTRRSAIQAISPILRGRSMQPVGTCVKGRGVWTIINFSFCQVPIKKIELRSKENRTFDNIGMFQKIE